MAEDGRPTAGNTTSENAGDTPGPIVIHPDVHGEIRSEVDGGFERRIEERRALSDPDGSVIPAGTLAADGQSYSPPELVSGESKRALGLDALRGLFLLLMTVDFTIASDALPAWMYHRQLSPNDMPLNIPGITWRDLVYPAFLFAMAAALPLAISRRVDGGEPEVGIVLFAFRRAFMLMFFAVLVGHSNTYFMGYTQPARAVAALGFVLMFMVFTRRRRDWSPTRYKVINRLGWVGAIAFLAFSPLIYGKTFSFERTDEIIAALAFAALAGSLIWYFTREYPNWRLAILALVVALYLGAHGGWIQDIWYNSPFPWLVDPSRLTILTVVIPGIIAGDQLLLWMRNAGRSPEPARMWSSSRIVLLSLLTTAFTPIVVVGLYNRYVEGTTGVVIVLAAAGIFLIRSPRTPGERMLRQLYLWAALWMILGLFLEPSEGGIKKTPETLSYFFTVTGLTSMLLVAMAGLADILEKRRFISALIDLGHNPMLGYVIYTAFLNSILEMIPQLRDVLRGSPGESMVRTILSTVMVVLIVRAFTRRRIFWRT